MWGRIRVDMRAQRVRAVWRTAAHGCPDSGGPLSSTKHSRFTLLLLLCFHQHAILRRETAENFDELVILPAELQLHLVRREQGAANGIGTLVGYEDRVARDQ